MFYCIQVLKEQSKNSKLKGDLVMEAVLEWESYFGQVNLSTRKKHQFVIKVSADVLVTSGIVFWYFDITGKPLQESTKL